MKKRMISILVCLCVALGMLPAVAMATTPGNISNFAEWQDAFANGGKYSLTDDITVTAGVTLASGTTLSINGNGHVIRPEVTGLDEQGLVNTNATVIENIILNQGNLTLENMTIYGGQGRCIQSEGTSSSKSSLTLNGVTLERAHSTSPGAGLYNNNHSNAVLINCNIRRNASEKNSGGFRNEGTLIMENCSIVENRNFGNMSGGGAGENKGSMYMNNCTVANNQSSEIGGGINNYQGILYVLNSTFTGNVSTDSRNSGGGIGNNKGTVYAANSVFAFNYAGGEISDIGIYSGTDVYLYNCTYGMISGGTAKTINSCKVLSGNATPSGVFNGSRVSGIIKRDGTEDTGETYDRPAVLRLDNGTYGVYPKNGSAVLSGGTKTYYERTDSTVKMAYGDNYTALDNLTAATTKQVNEYQNGDSRGDGVMGALPASNAVATVYTVVVNAAKGGSVIGGSALGNTYVDGANLEITAVPDDGYTFVGWKLGNETTPSSYDSTYVITNLSADVVLTPMFSPAASTAYTVTVTNGSATPNGEQAAGKVITITADAAPNGKVFDKWIVTGVSVADETSATTTFTMPAGNVTAEATYKDAPVTTYTVRFNANGGDGTMADVTGISGEYTLPANGFTAPDGKQFKAWSVGGVEKAVGDKITVTADITVTAVWEDVSLDMFGTIMLQHSTYTATMMPEKNVPDYFGLHQMELLAQSGSFTDVFKSDWFYSDVTALANKGVVRGYPDGSFRPQGTVTWGEALKLVMKAVGYGDIAPSNDHWASGYMDMAIEKLLISGEVDLDAAITRGEMADLTAKAMKLGKAAVASPFDDEAPDSAAVLYEAGIIKGSADNGQLLFRAESTITRAEMAAVIWRVYCAR